MKRARPRPSVGSSKTISLHNLLGGRDQPHLVRTERIAAEACALGAHAYEAVPESGSAPGPGLAHITDLVRSRPRNLVGMSESQTDAGLHLLVRQMREASGDGLYFAALVLALTLPDMCAALSAENGRASRSKYQTWLAEHLPTSIENAAGIYDFRCSLLHQGSAHPQSGGPRLAFIEPSPGQPQLHNLSTDVGGDVVGWISVPMFVDEVGQAVERWFLRYGESTLVARNMQRFVRRRPGGLPPHVAGAPVIA